jgi:hypothetical protein
MTARSTRRLPVLLGPALILALVLSPNRTPVAAQESPTGGKAVAANASSVASSDAHSPSSVMFVENAGQWDERARFQVWDNSEAIMWLTEDAIWLTLVHDPGSDVARSGFDLLERIDPEHVKRQGSGEQRKVANVKLSFVDANPHPSIEPFNPLDTVVSYFIGNDPDEWRAGVPVWGGVRYVDLYTGIDLEITREGGQMVQRLVCSADCGAALADVRLRIDGAERIELRPVPAGVSGAGVSVEGTQSGVGLWLTTAAGEYTLPLPRLIGISPISVVPPTLSGREVTTPFVTGVGRHDDPSTVTDARSAVLSPQASGLLFSTFLGGSAVDDGRGIAVDSSGAAYVTGRTVSTNFPTTPGAFDTSFDQSGHLDAIVAKLNPAGSALSYATFLGGTGDDVGIAIAVDSGGAAYVMGGVAGSYDFPTTSGAFDRSYSGTDDAFMAKLDPSGSALSYATFLGGSDVESGNSIAVDSSGAAYVTGTTFSTDFPTTPGAFDTTHDGSNPEDAFVAKLNSTGSALSYATFLGGSGGDYGYSIAVDPSDSAYVAGLTDSTNFPTTPGAYDRSCSGVDAFVAKLNLAGSALGYATFLGGTGDDGGLAIAVDANGAAYVAGMTDAADFPATPGASDTSPNGAYDAFLARLSLTGSALGYATLLGGAGDDIGVAIVVDGGGAAYVTGMTQSANFPATPGAFDTTHNGGEDVFVAKLNPSGSGFSYATLLGGSSNDAGFAIAIDSSGAAYVTGYTGSSGFPTTPGALDTVYNGGNYDAFVARVSSGALRVIRGRVTSGHYQPLTHVLVGLFAELGASYVVTTTTDSGGFYELPNVLSAGRYQLRVELHDDQNRTQMRWGENQTLVTARTPWFTANDVGPSVSNIDFANPLLDAAPVAQEDLDDLATIYFHTRQAQDFIRHAQGLGEQDLAPIHYIWAYRPLPLGEINPVVGYDEENHLIYMSAFASRYAEVGRPMNREWHENFHHLMKVSLGELKLCATPGCNHKGLDNPDTADSWTEGWAEFWPCVLADYLGQSPPYLYRMSYVPISLEHNWKVWDRQLGITSREELAVASLLWDLYDPKGPADQDYVDLSLDQLWSLLGHTAADNNLNHMRDVYLRLKGAALVNEDGSEVSEWDLDKVFAEHGFFADNDGDRLWGLYEEVGWGGSQGRSNFQPVPNAYVKAVIQDEKGQPITEGTVLVKVQHQNSYYDYQAQLSLDPDAGGMLYVEMPPPRIPATATLTIASGGGVSEPLQIRNDDYWSLVEQSTTGYAIEHTFTIRYRVYVPMIMRQ